MHSSDPNPYQKFFTTPPPPPQPPSAPPPFTDASAAATGIPVSSNSSMYVEDPTAVQSKTEVPWSSGLCACTSDVRNCCITFWCPCITFGQIAEIVDKGSSSCGESGALYALIGCVTGSCCIYSCFYRSKIRQQYTLKATPCCDCLVHCCCEYCALCQEYRELKSRGYDMAIGWHGNMERRNREMMTMAPTVESGMSKQDV